LNIYIGNLPYSSTEEDLRDLFTEYGDIVSAKVITDRETGRSRGFGFVEMGDDAAKKAIEELDGAEFDGKELRVNESKPKTGGFSNNNRNRYDNNRRRY